ncbi:MAG: 23S rRNA pseudouridine(955/2504/2580) synthase RluC [Chromatiales bacterium]|jgi:23S rRNA pseudouridine955/2504/2580 synthase
MSEVTGKKVSWVTVDQEFAGQRLDNFLLRQLKGVPRSYIYRIIRKGEVRVNKGRSSVKYKLQANDVVRIPPVRQTDGEAGNKPYQILKDKLENTIIYEDNSLIVLNKPSGMAVHGGSGVSFGVIETLRSMRPQDQHLELAHRLDRETSGCLIISKKRSALRMIHELQRTDGITKKYLALVWGDWGKKGALEVDVPLRKNTLQGGERMVQVDAAGKPSKTRFRVLERFADSMLVSAELLTGRTHQIRVHCTHAGTPILGDDKYGDAEANRLYRERGLRRLFLHAVSLAFKTPDNGEEMRFSAPLDDELEQVLNKLRMSLAQ